MKLRLQFCFDARGFTKNASRFQLKPRTRVGNLWFKPINDAAERAVKFGSDFHNCLAQDPLQHQAVLQTVESHRREKPNATKH